MNAEKEKNTFVPFVLLLERRKEKCACFMKRSWMDDLLQKKY